MDIEGNKEPNNNFVGMHGSVNCHPNLEHRSGLYCKR